MTWLGRSHDAFNDFTKPTTHHYAAIPTTSAGAIKEEDQEDNKWTMGQNRMFPEPEPPVRIQRGAWKCRGRLPSGLTFTRYHMDINALDEVADCSAPEPELQSHQFKGMPSSEEFSHDHEWTDVNDSAIYDDIKLLKNRDELQVGPLAKKMAIEMNRNSRCPWGLSVLNDSTSTDPLGEYSIAFPSTGWQNKEELFRACVDEKARYLLHTEMLSLYGAGRNYHSLIQNGLDTFLDLGIAAQHRALLVSQCTLEEVSEELRLNYPSAYAMRKLNHTECCYLSNNCLNLKTRNIKIIGDMAFDISFGNKEDLLKFFRRCPKAVKFPVILEGNLSSNDNEVYGIKLSWYPYPSMRYAELIVKNSKDVGYACFVLNEHTVRAMPAVANDSENKKVRLNLFEGDVDSYDNEKFEHKIKTILSANHIDYDRIMLFRTRERAMDTNTLWQKIHQRIGRTAMNTGIWETVPGEEVPGHDDEWANYVSRHHQTFPWKVHLDAYTSPFTVKENEMKRQKQEQKKRSSDEVDVPQHVNLAAHDPSLGVLRTATVTFKSRDVAEKIINYLQPISPHKDTLAFTHKDKYGVRFSPFYRIERNVPHCVRGVINAFLENEESDFVATSDYHEGKWCQYLDGPLNTQMIVLQGWPIARVKEAAERLEQRLAGLEIDCGDPEGAGRLLYGVGLAYVNKIQRENKGKVVISISRLEKKMWIIGSLDEDCPETRDKLMRFCHDREKYTIRYSISLAKPRFLPFFKEYIRGLVTSNHGNKLGVYLGNPDLKIFGHELRFVGNVVQYERLQELLDQLQKKMLDSYREVFPRDRFEFRDINCPLCLVQVTQSNYRLTICGHLYCQDCLCKMISFQMKNNELPVRCRYAKEGRECLERVAVRDVMLLLFDKNFSRFPYFFKDRLEQLLRATTDFAIKQSKGRLRHCPRPDCKGLFWKSYVNSNVEGQVICGVCSFCVCHNCFYPPHSGVSCEVETRIRQSADESINYYMTRLKGRAKRCPNENCRGVIEKDAGCNHLHCLFCHTHFCWQCEFTADRESEVYGHMRQVHGGTGGGYDYLDYPPGLGPPPGIPIHHPPPLMNLHFGQHGHILGVDEDMMPEDALDEDDEDVDVVGPL